VLRPLHAADAGRARRQDRYGVTLERNAIQIFDPTSAKGKQLGKKRKALFAEVRERFLKELEEIPIASKMVRLQQLQAHYEKAADDGNVRLALDVLEKAAKEAGGAHSNERTVNLTGRLARRAQGRDRGRHAQRRRGGDRRGPRSGAGKSRECDKALMFDVAWGYQSSGELVDPGFSSRDNPEGRAKQLNILRGRVGGLEAALRPSKPRQAAAREWPRSTGASAQSRSSWPM
jgi:hypothetical protein